MRGATVDVVDGGGKRWWQEVVDLRGAGVRSGEGMKTWHCEAAVHGAVLSAAWFVDQVAAGSLDPWSVGPLLLAYVGGRLDSVADRHSEVSESRPDLLSCWGEVRVYALVAQVVGWCLAARPWVERLMTTGRLTPLVGSVAVAASAWRWVYPRWRARWRRRHGGPGSPGVAIVRRVRQ